MFDLSQYDTTRASNEGVKFYPVLPGDDEPTDQCYFVVLGADSDAFRKIKIAEARRALSMSNGKRKKQDAERTDEELLAMVEGKTETIAALIKDWSGVAMDGEPLPYSHENAVKLLDSFPWLKRQINVFAGDVANFLPSASSHGPLE